MNGSRLALVFLAAWCMGLTVGFGFVIHELKQTREQAVVAQDVSARANEQTDKWARDYAFHVKFYHYNKEK